MASRAERRASALRRRTQQAWRRRLQSGLSGDSGGVSANRCRAAQAHIQATFNNTLVTITDPNGNVALLEQRRRVELQRLAQEHAVRRADHGGDRGAQGDGAWRAADRGLRPWAGSGREAAIRALAGGWPSGGLDHRCDADPAQWLPPTQAPPRLVGANRRIVRIAFPCIDPLHD